MDKLFLPELSWEEARMRQKGGVKHSAVNGRISPEHPQYIMGEDQLILYTWLIVCHVYQLQ